MKAACATKLGITVISALVIALSQASAAPPIYNATRIGALPGGNASFGTDINFNGDVVGWSWTNGTTAPHAWRYSGTTLTDFGTLGGVGATAHAINDAGNYVGLVTLAGGGFAPYVVTGGTGQLLSVTGATGGNVYDINANGQIAGDLVFGGVRSATIYTQAGVTNLGTFGRTSATASAINDSGQVAGWTSDGAGGLRAFRFSGGSFTDLGTLPGGTVSQAIDINARGEVVGYSTTSGVNTPRAFLYAGGQLTSLGTLGGSTSAAQSINDSGQIVGEALTGLGATNGFLYTDGAMYDLNTLVVSGLGGARLTNGIAINNKGQIVAQACPTAITCQTFKLDPTAPAGKVRAIEYYHAGFDHYFLTTIDDEVTKLDNGTFVGWARTGESLNLDSTAAAGTVTVCRFFSATFAPKSSHFYTPFTSECDTVKADPVWTFEGDVFRVALPDSAGACAAGRIAVYRLYNNGMSGAPNHRYTTSLNIRTAMIARGWIPEGLGPQGVIMCV
ncbi:MAG TPA: hypothetical protein VNE58_10025 [Casimicrobiaceae bacterium]|nr:hypothetical protein [Casimicrobiaceae bacterium]